KDMLPEPVTLRLLERPPAERQEGAVAEDDVEGIEEQEDGVIVRKSPHPEKVTGSGKHRDQKEEIGQGRNEHSREERLRHQKRIEPEFPYQRRRIPHVHQPGLRPPLEPSRALRNP